VQPSRVALVDLFEPYLAAFVDWSAAQGVEPAILHSSNLAPPRASVRLCVAGVSGEAQASRERIGAIRKGFDGCPIVLVAREIGIDAVAAMMRAGIADVIGTPAAPSHVVARASAQAASPSSSQELAGESPTMQSLRREMGVGKGVVAQSIHQLSGRADRPFVHVDCAALAPSVIESELFGHERGAFTGAVGARAGRFELAQDGTILLDEIGDLDPGLQTKLLRVLQDREYERVGGATTRVMTARVVAATNRDLRAAVEKGSFRADLYFRLNVFRIHVPPLREHPADIPAFVDAGIQRVADRLRLPPPILSEALYGRLCTHPWPGNVRELMNVLERLAIRHHGRVLDDAAIERALDEELVATAAAGRPADPSDERSRIEAALRCAGGNVSRAARRLGMARGTLRYRIRQNQLAHLIPSD